MNTHLKLENQSWPRENAKHTKQAGLLLNVAGRSDFSPLKPLLRSSLCALWVLLWQSTLAGVHYVDVNSTNATPPYTSWTTAATNIQDAVDAAVAGDEIVVTNGIYATGERAIDGVNRVVVDKPLNVRSVNGPQSTTIDGSYSFRCVYLANGASLSGFTLMHGLAFNGGGGAIGGSLNDCAVIGNQVRGTFIPNPMTHQFDYVPGYGGGAYACSMTHCTLSSNSVSLNLNGNGSTYDRRSYGGGAAYCQLNNCTLTANSAIANDVPCFITAYAEGGGAAFSILNNCALSRNLASVTGPCLANSYANGGGAYNCTLNNCTLSGNSASLPDYSFNREYANGGGAYNCTLNNCTLSGNSSGVTSYRLGRSGASGGGAYGGTLNNCISFTNFQFSYWSNNFSCADCGSPGSLVDNNWLGNPLFVDLGAGNLRLQSNSPCINAGLNSLAPAGPDLDGNPRIAGGTVDIGAYEFQFPVSQISYAWLQHFNLPINPSTDTADPDGDGVNNYREWLAGSDPTNPFSFPPLLTLIPYGANVILTWPTNAVGFTLQSTTNLVSPAAWSTNSPGPVVIGGQNVVINPITSAQKFFRLISN